MLSLANLEAQKLDKHELIKLVSDPPAIPGKDAAPAPKKSADKKLSPKKSVELNQGEQRQSVGKGKKPVGRSSQVKVLHILSEDEIDEPGSGCFKCPCCPRRSKKNGVDERTAALWREKYCKTYEDFHSQLVTSTKHASLSIPSFNEIKRELSFENDPTARGLSSFGGLMWTLTYGIQHLVDSTGKVENMAKELVSIRAIYQDIGAIAQKFVLMAEQYGERMEEIHTTTEDVVKRLTKRYKFTNDPLYLHPPYIPRPIHLRKRIGYEPPPGCGHGGQRAADRRGSTISRSGSADDDELFHVNWSPLTIVVQLPQSSDWDIFSGLPVAQRLSVYKLFVKQALDTLEMLIRKFADAVNYTSASSNKIAGKEKKSRSASNVDLIKNRSPLFEVTTAMDSFMKSLHRSSRTPEPTPPGDASKGTEPNHDPNQEPTEPHEIDRLQLIVEDFWFTLDTMYELSVEIERLVQETRDVVKTCYVYATYFYKWKLADYDTFDPKTKTKEYKANQKQIKTTLAKILGQRRFSDAAMFISLADFTSSIYQKVAQKHEYSAAGYTMKLNTWEDEEPETWGLLGVDAIPRKSIVG